MPHTQLRRTRSVLPLALGTALLAAPAAARITTIEITESGPFADGQDFGAGPYLRLVGKARGELDPADPRNMVISDLDQAPRNARGMVEYVSDVMLLRPADPARSSGRLIHEITNRGRKLLFSYVFDAARPNQTELNDLRTAASVGLATPLREGATLVWNGWDPDLARAGGLMAIDLPELPGVTGDSRDEFVFGPRITAGRSDAPLSYPVADLDQARAALTVRRTRDGVVETIPSSGWSYTGGQAIQLLPPGTAFTPGSIYDFSYPATGAKPLGMGFAATRDLVSFLRHAPNSPLAGVPVRAVYAVGISQAGRYLRHHVELGMNADESGQRVFDGGLAHIAGSGKMFMNERFAQPGRTATWHEDTGYPETWFPLAAAETRDPLSGRSAGLLRADANDPFLMEVNTSTEYWQKGASLIHTDPGGRRDLPELPNVRHYLVAGTRHAGRAGLNTAAGLCVQSNNPHSAGPLLRALLVALDGWVVENRAPPPSRVPRLADATLVPASAVLEAFPPIPGLIMPRFANPMSPLLSWVTGTRGDATAWLPLVPAVDTDGNERAGVRLPDIAVPLATYTGWNLYAPADLRGELCDREGTFVPFPATATARAASGDPRAAVTERYPKLSAYVSAVRDTSDALVRDRLLLPADAAAFVRAAGRRPGVPD